MGDRVATRPLVMRTRSAVPLLSVLVDDADGSNGIVNDGYVTIVGNGGDGLGKQYSNH